MAENVPTCQIDKKNKWIKCADAPLSGDTDGLCILHSREMAKDREGFKEALMARWLRDGDSYDFRGVFFPERFNPFDFFANLVFKKPAYFSKAIFAKGASFYLATFEKDANFEEVTFRQGASFSGATFEQAGNFSGARFAQGAVFYQASFAQTAHFARVTFRQGADFTGVTFAQGVDFRAAAISGRVFFQYLTSQKVNGAALSFWGDFCLLKFQESGAITYQDVNLANCLFAGTDLRRPEFHHVTWHCLSARQALYDEVLLRQKELSLGKKILILTGLVTAPEKPPPTADNYAEVERLYRNLQVNYESVNDYKSSGDFHYGELEMHRKASPWRWFPFYWYNLYWLTSGYGERPLRSLLVLWGFFLAFAGLFFWLEPSLPGGHTWGGLGNAVLYVFQKGTLQRPDSAWVEQATGLSKFLAAIIPILIPGQVALFLLALRNRMGRRR